MFGAAVRVFFSHCVRSMSLGGSASGYPWEALATRGEGATGLEENGGWRLCSSMMVVLAA